MNWDAIGATGEWAGAIAVVLTLGYLALQIRQTNKIARADSYSKIIDAHVGHHRTLNARPELVDIWHRGLIDYEELNQAEKWSFHTFIGPLVLEFQKYWFLHREGLVPDETFDMFERDIVASLLAPGGNQWWQDCKGKWPEVSDYLDRRISELDGDVTPTHLDFGGLFAANESSCAAIDK